MRLYNDELREINRKTRQVYLKRGIYPFLDSNATRDNDSYIAYRVSDREIIP